MSFAQRFRRSAEAEINRLVMDEKGQNVFMSGAVPLWKYNLELVVAIVAMLLVLEYVPDGSTVLFQTGVTFLAFLGACAVLFFGCVVAVSTFRASRTCGGE